MKKYILYYILGGVILSISLIAFSIVLIIPNIFRIEQWVGWILVVISIILFLLVIFSIYLLKKGTFLKVNNKSDEIKNINEAKFKELLDKKYYEVENRQNDEED